MKAWDLRCFKFQQLRSVENETAFFSLMGRFFASPSVRRDCGGYPLCDGPRYRWFIVQRIGESRVLGFISVEESGAGARIRDGYVRPECRGRGLFRELLRRVNAYIEQEELSAEVRLRSAAVACFHGHGFTVRSVRGQWITMEK